MTEYMCPIHQTTHNSQPCPQCVERIQNAPDPEQMTGDERAAEVQMWCDIKVLTVGWDRLVGRFEALVGRGIFTHEFAYNQEGLIAEARGTKAPPQFLDEIIATLPEGVEVITFDMNEGQPQEFSDN